MDTTWTAKCNSQVARDVRDLLEEVLKEMDLLKDPIVISAFPKRVHETYSAEHTVRVVDEKAEIALMLVKRGVLKAAQPFLDERPWADPKRGIVVLAERADVEAVLDAFGRPARIAVPMLGQVSARSSPPMSPQAAFPSAPPVVTATSPGNTQDSLSEVRRRTHAQEQVKLLYWALGIALVALVSLVFSPVRRWVGARAEAFWGEVLGGSANQTVKPSSLAASGMRGSDSSAAQPPSGPGVKARFASDKPPEVAGGPRSLAKFAITRPRTHPLEFELLADSLIVDALFDQGDSTGQKWPKAGLAVPELLVEVYYTKLTRVSLIDSMAVSGEWVGGNRGRAVFVAPRLRTFERDLLITPRVLTGQGYRFPAVTGENVDRRRRAWELRLKADKDGTILQGRWKWAPDPDAGAFG